MICKQQIFFVQNYGSVLSMHRGKEIPILFVTSLNYWKVIHSFFFSNKENGNDGKREGSVLAKCGTGQKWPYKDRMARIEHHKYFKKLFCLHGK